MCNSLRGFFSSTWRSPGLPVPFFCHFPTQRTMRLYASTVLEKAFIHHSFIHSFIQSLEKKEKEKDRKKKLQKEKEKKELNYFFSREVK